MRVLWVAALLVVSGASFSSGQQASPSAQPPQADAQPAPVKVYSVGPEVTAPELLRLNLTPIPDEKCKKKQRVEGRVVLSLLVDETGAPRNIMFLSHSARTWTSSHSSLPRWIASNREPMTALRLSSHSLWK